MLSFLSQPGFLGTSAPLLSDLSLILILVSIALFTIGVFLVRSRKFKAHHWVQSTAWGLNTLVVLVVMIRSFIVYILPGIPSQLLKGNYGITTLHALIGATAVILGTISVWRSTWLEHKGIPVGEFKRVMITSYFFYLAAATLGVIVYITTYMTYPA